MYIRIRIIIKIKIDSILLYLLELVGGPYYDHVFYKINYSQMADFVQNLISKLEIRDGVLKILEMGAGMGGTTLYMAPLLARLGVSVEYTFTDLSAPWSLLQGRNLNNTSL